MTNKKRAKPQIGLVLRAALMVSALLGPLARQHLMRRLNKAKEDPQRWREKLGETQAKRPDGPLIWLHGVGVGEVMALRGLIQHLSRARPELNFLVTSSARSSGDVFTLNLPPRTQHQYLPLDVRKPVTRFLDHWRPDLAVWSDQDLWPRLAVTCARRAIPQALVAARITQKSAKAKARFDTAFGDLYRLLDLRHAQDAHTAAALKMLMDDDSAVHVTGSIKATAAPLSYDPRVSQAFIDIAMARRTWLLSSSHPADEAVALAAHALLRKQDTDALLIIAPRDATRAQDIAMAAQAHGLSTATRRHDTPQPKTATAVYIADTYGELGTWYRAVPRALIGGTFDATQGHNPWEAVALGTAVLHGPQTGNFASDYAALGAAQGSQLIHTAHDLANALLAPLPVDMIKNANDTRIALSRGLSRIANDLLDLLDAQGPSDN